VKKHPLFYHGALLIVSLIYGINYSILKSVTPEYILPFGFIIYRIFIAGIIFWIISIGTKEKVDWKSDGWRLVGCGLFGVTFNQLLFFKGVSITTAVNASIFMTLSPIFVFVMALVFLNEKLKPWRIAGLVLAMAGALILIYQPGTQISVGNWFGDVLIILNGLSYAVYLIIVKPLMSKYHTATVTKWIFLIGFIPAIPFGIEEAMQVEWSQLPTFVWWSVLYIILGVTVVVYFLNAWTLRYVSASLVGIYIYLQPVFATFTAVLFFGEAFTWIHVQAAVLIFTGIYLVNKR